MASGKAFLALPCTCCGGGGAKVCKGCRLAHFCSRECQRAAWAQHALSCTSAKHGACSPGPKLELVDTGLQGRFIPYHAPFIVVDSLLVSPRPALARRTHRAGGD